jgi:hypothetical protein
MQICCAHSTDLNARSAQKSSRCYRVALTRSMATAEQTRGATHSHSYQILCLKQFNHR